MKRLTPVLMGLAALGLFPAPSDAFPPPAAEKNLTPAEIYQRTLKSTVWVLPVSEKSGNTIALTGSSGSGSLIDVTNRLVLTNYHVVGEHDEMMIFFPHYENGKLVTDNKSYLARAKESGGTIGKVLVRVKEKDLAIVQLPALPKGAQALRLSKDSVGTAEQVHSVGNPGASGALWAYTDGAVKQVYQKDYITGSKDGSDKFKISAKVVETTSPVNPGDSGGPLVNSRGELVAVTQGGDFGARAISFFIDISEVHGVLKMLPKGVKPKVAIGPGAPPVAGGDETASDTTAKTPDAATTVKTPDTGKTDPKTPAVSTADKEKAEKVANSKLELIQRQVDGGDKSDRVQQKLKDLIKAYPGTDAAKAAEELLKKLK
jgi:S1-C subfamily serine protease